MQKRSEKMVLFKNDILDKAVEVFSQKGYKATTMQDIADALNTTRTPLNYHFKNKKMLYEEVIRRYLKKRCDDYEAIDAQSESFADMIWMHLRRCCNTLLENRLLDGLQEDEFKELAELNVKTNTYLRDMKKRCILRAIDTGELRADLDVDLLTDFLYVQFYGLLRIAVDLPLEKSYAQINFIADMLKQLDIWGSASAVPMKGNVICNQSEPPIHNAAR